MIVVFTKQIFTNSKKVVIIVNSATH
ncbi:uncharacterized protein METZ01_LOCUS130803 [marine metagenome]|uniref:Uncharacterized protein n=1 Tax=marine metagenome TaxID=408172 RepID=A0A381YLV0_9ZZZZ